MDPGSLDEAHVWRTMFLAMVAWAAHFAVIYAAALIFVGGAPVLIINVIATLLGLVAIFWLWNRLPPSRPKPALLALGIAGAGILFDAAPTFLA